MNRLKTTAKKPYSWSQPMDFQCAIFMHNLLIKWNMTGVSIECSPQKNRLICKIKMPKLYGTRSNYSDHRWRAISRPSYTDTFDIKLHEHKLNEFLVNELKHLEDHVTVKSFVLSCQTSFGKNRKRPFLVHNDAYRMENCSLAAQKVRIVINLHLFENKYLFHNTAQKPKIQLSDFQKQWIYFQVWFALNKLANAHFISQNRGKSRSPPEERGAFLTGVGFAPLRKNRKWFLGAPYARHLITNPLSDYNWVNYSLNVPCTIFKNTIGLIAKCIANKTVTAYCDSTDVEDQEGFIVEDFYYGDAFNSKLLGFTPCKSLVHHEASIDTLFYQMPNPKGISLNKDSIFDVEEQSGNSEHTPILPPKTTADDNYHSLDNEDDDASTLPINMLTPEYAFWTFLCSALPTTGTGDGKCFQIKNLTMKDIPAQAKEFEKNILQLFKEGRITLMQDYNIPNRYYTRSSSEKQFTGVCRTRRIIRHNPHYFHPWYSEIKNSKHPWFNQDKTLQWPTALLMFQKIDPPTPTAPPSQDLNRSSGAAASAEVVPPPSTNNAEAVPPPSAPPQTSAMPSP